ncbi:hypothetical protein Ahia01_001085200, partial [Argonauta hians]
KFQSVIGMASTNMLCLVVCVLIGPVQVLGWFDRIRFQESRMGAVMKCEFPSVVFIKFTNQTFHQKECGGVILDSQRVATAAHCVLPKLRKVELKTGIIDSSRRGIQLSWRRVITMTSNRRTRSKGNVAIITLARPIQFFSCYKPIQLATPEDDFMDRACLAIGWVLDSKTNKKLLTKTHQSIAPKAECSKDGRSLEYGELCAAGMEFGFGDTCLGDSGIPLICLRENGDQVLTGFAEPGDVCSDKNSVFSDVATHNQWLSTKH